MKVYLEALVGWYFQSKTFFSISYMLWFNFTLCFKLIITSLSYITTPQNERQNWTTTYQFIIIHTYCTFKLINVNTAPNSPPIMPIITVGMNARIFKPMPWLICSETNISAWCVLSWGPLEGCGCVKLQITQQILPQIQMQTKGTSSPINFLWALFLCFLVLHMLD